MSALAEALVAADEQARWDEAQDEALRVAAERLEHTEDVP